MKLYLSFFSWINIALSLYSKTLSKNRQYLFKLVGYDDDSNNAWQFQDNKYELR